MSIIRVFILSLVVSGALAGSASASPKTVESCTLAAWQEASLGYEDLFRVTVDEIAPGKFTLDAKAVSKAGREYLRTLREGGHRLPAPALKFVTPYQELSETRRLQLDGEVEWFRRDPRAPQFQPSDMGDFVQYSTAPEAGFGLGVEQVFDRQGNLAGKLGVIPFGSAFCH